MGTIGCGVLGGENNPGNGGGVGNGAGTTAQIEQALIEDRWAGGWAQIGATNTAERIPPGNVMFEFNAGAGGPLIESSGIYYTFLTGAVPGNAAGIGTTSGLHWTATVALFEAVWVMRTGPVISDVRWWFYFTSNAGPGAVDNIRLSDTLENSVSFRYSTAAGDTNFMSQTGDALGNTTTYDTGVPVQINTRYIMRIVVLQTFDIYFFITDGSLFGGAHDATNADLVTRHTFGVPGLPDAFMPTTTQGLTSGDMLTTLDANPKTHYLRTFKVRGF